ncbi:ABC-type cobalt transport system,permease protein [Candidatus Phytoplasma australiense]|uniref:ABC-type cobalt transport system,permease protein n=2 Tax=Phytoplasma australiense TaxID=59748 RepID=B1V942_PHYAS|nr:energy-coupling factor transporter transmembrane component T [Candidatus Phytoplasma australiense]AGL90790.1 ABC-type cobalt transporter, permease component [Strawberry lethal yellows phytoplasma (CPA) str. NZSb11]CAM11474.1 ABC-type cobalt transport system,permease protein [Candidatus Phytoplasma australiense]
MNQNFIFKYQKQKNFIYQIQGATKLFFLLLVSIACMLIYNIWFLLGMSVFNSFLFLCAQIKWRQVEKIIKGFLLFLLINNLIIFLFFRKQGIEIYQSQTWILKNFITQEQIFYQINLILKYLSVIPLFLIFIFTTNPSELAASLNKWGISYKISYSLALTLRYIPAIKKDFENISLTQQTRLLPASPKGNFISKIVSKIKKLTLIIPSLIFVNLDKIEIIGNAMELRRFGKNKKRTWYYQTKLTFLDVLTIFLGVHLLFLSIFLLMEYGRFYYPFVKKTPSN